MCWWTVLKTITLGKSVEGCNSSVVVQVLLYLQSFAIYLHVMTHEKKEKVDTNCCSPLQETAICLCVACKSCLSKLFQIFEDWFKIQNLNLWKNFSSPQQTSKQEHGQSEGETKGTKLLWKCDLNLPAPNHCLTYITYTGTQCDFLGKSENEAAKCIYI